MTSRLVWNGYGKAAVRLVKVERGGARDELHDLTVEIQLQGAFEQAHVAGDNTAVLPTDTMKNTVYALARSGAVDPPEQFGERLARHFLDASPAARTAVVAIAVHRWDRLAPDGAPDQHSFARVPAERRLATVTVNAAGIGVEAGLDGLGLLRTTGSGFSGFLRDRYTTLQDTDDRILATDVEARWKYTRPPGDYGAAWGAVRAALIQAFARHQSASVQHTLYAMGDAALAASAEMSEIHLVLPNRHHFLVDLAPFGMDNPNQVFAATPEPYGRIEAVVGRSG